MATISALKFRNEMGEMLDRVRIDKEPLVITKHNRPVAVVVGIEMPRDTEIKRTLSPVELTKINRRLAKFVGQGAKISLGREKILIKDYLRRKY